LASAFNPVSHTNRLAIPIRFAVSYSDSVVRVILQMCHG
jgi:hypothetical protein